MVVQGALLSDYEGRSQDPIGTWPGASHEPAG